MVNRSETSCPKTPVRGPRCQTLRSRDRNPLDACSAVPGNGARCPPARRLSGHNYGEPCNNLPAGRVCDAERSILKLRPSLSRLSVS